MIDRGTILRVWIPLVAGSWALGVIFSSHLGSRGPARWIGLVLGVIGLTGVISARYTLGRSFSIRAKATELVTTGIYSRIRNPIYISGEIFVVGVAIMLWKPYFLLAVLAVIPMQILRARREASVLEAKFGDEYRQYRQRTWF